MVTATHTRHRILVVDDHSIVRHGLSLLLQREKDFTVCAEAGTYEEAIETATREKPDVAVIDLTLKDRSGLDLIKELGKQSPETRCLVLSMHDEAEYADRALRAGAKGYVMKEDADAVIVEAIRRVLAGEIYVSPAMSNRLIRQMSDDRTQETGIASLTDREQEIFACVGEGLSSRKIAEKFNLSERTVEVHRANIKKKLGLEDAAQMLREAVRWVESRK